MRASLFAPSARPSASWSRRLPVACTATDAECGTFYRHVQEKYYALCTKVAQLPCGYSARHPLTVIGRKRTSPLHRAPLSCQVPVIPPPCSLTLPHFTSIPPFPPRSPFRIQQAGRVKILHLCQPRGTPPSLHPAKTLQKLLSALQALAPRHYPLLLQAASCLRLESATGASNVDSLIPPTSAAVGAVQGGSHEAP